MNEKMWPSQDMGRLTKLFISWGTQLLATERDVWKECNKHSPNLLRDIAHLTLQKRKMNLQNILFKIKNSGYVKQDINK